MGILSSLFGLNSKEEEKPAVVKVFTKSVVEPTIKESLANLAIKVIGASGKPIKEYSDKEWEAKRLLDSGTYIRTDTIISNKEIKYLKIGEEFDDRTIFYIDPQKRYVVTSLCDFNIYIIKSGYTSSASGKLNQIY